MEPKILALKLFLDALGVSDDISTVDDRKRVQKAVYLGQLRGADLGYRFGWYLMGPYSPALTRDYFALGECIASEGPPPINYQLHPDLKRNLEEIAPFLTPPPDLNLNQSDWLELLASLHYLSARQSLATDQAVAKLRETKPHLGQFIDRGLIVLKFARFSPAP